jgi:hypothetical protein
MGSRRRNSTRAGEARSDHEGSESLPGESENQPSDTGSRQPKKPWPDLADIHGRLGEVRCVLMCVVHALAEVQDPGDADAEPIDVEDERVTLKQAIGLLDVTMDAIDQHFL